MARTEPPRMYLYLPLEMQYELKSAAERLHISASELVRRIVDGWREQQRSEDFKNGGFVDVIWTEEQLQAAATRRLLELSRWVVSQEAQVREIASKAAAAGQTIDEWITENRFTA